MSLPRFSNYLDFIKQTHDKSNPIYTLYHLLVFFLKSQPQAKSSFFQSWLAKNGKADHRAFCEKIISQIDLKAIKPQDSLECKESHIVKTQDINDIIRIINNEAIPSELNELFRAYFSFYNAYHVLLNEKLRIQLPIIEDELIAFNLRPILDVLNVSLASDDSMRQTTAAKTLYNAFPLLTPTERRTIFPLIADALVNHLKNNKETYRGYRGIYQSFLLLAEEKARKFDSKTTHYINQEAASHLANIIKKYFYLFDDKNRDEIFQILMYQLLSKKNDATANSGYILMHCFKDLKQEQQKSVLTALPIPIYRFKSEEDVEHYIHYFLQLSQYRRKEAFLALHDTYLSDDDISYYNEYAVRAYAKCMELNDPEVNERIFSLCCSSGATDHRYSYKGMAILHYSHDLFSKTQKASAVIAIHEKLIANDNDDLLITELIAKLLGDIPTKTIALIFADICKKHMTSGLDLYKFREIVFHHIKDHEAIKNRLIDAYYDDLEHALVEQRPSILIELAEHFLDLNAAQKSKFINYCFAILNFRTPTGIDDLTKHHYETLKYYAKKTLFQHTTYNRGQITDSICAELNDTGKERYELSFIRSGYAKCETAERNKIFDTLIKNNDLHQLSKIFNDLSSKQKFIFLNKCKHFIDTKQISSYLIKYLFECIYQCNKDDECDAHEFLQQMIFSITQSISSSKSQARAEFMIGLCKNFAIFKNQSTLFNIIFPNALGFGSAVYDSFVSIIKELSSKQRDFVFKFICNELVRINDRASQYSYERLIDLFEKIVAFSNYAERISMLAHIDLALHGKLELHNKPDSYLLLDLVAIIHRQKEADKLLLHHLPTAPVSIIQSYLTCI